MYRRSALWLFLALLVWVGGSSVIAAPVFPDLTGRVVDNANLLTPEQTKNLETLLESYEEGTTNQIVVLTLSSLNGYAIDDYGYQLGRHWQLGQKGKNNGVILLVAPKERKVRIEVGYGLEPILTDAISSEIIQTVILPQFKKGNFATGIVDGTQSILDVLGGKKILKKRPPEKKSDWVDWMLFLLIFFALFIRNPSLGFLIFAGSGQRFGGSSKGGGSGGGGGFGGGGGSFGGGGSSGSW